MLVSEEVAGSITGEMKKFPYSIPEYKVLEGKTILITNEGEFQLKVFGKHNLMNLEGARLVCNQLNISNLDFYNAISSFSGASNRLELIAKKAGFNAYRDFAHALAVNIVVAPLQIVVVPVIEVGAVEIEFTVTA